MTTIHLVRHALHDSVARVLVGRNDAVTLSVEGIRQAQCLAAHFAPAKIDRVQSSPQPRARHTAQPVAAVHALPLEIVSDVDEIDTGAWTGRGFAELAADPLWQRWNTERGSCRPPGGESMQALQQRAVRHLSRLQTEEPGGTVVVVTHAETIRAVVLHCLGRPLDHYLSVTVVPASITTIRLQPEGWRTVSVNGCAKDAVAA